MHGHPSAQTLPTLKRQTVAAGTGRGPTHTLSESARRRTALPTEDEAGTTDSSLLPAGASRSYGRPWNTPTMLNTLASSVALQRDADNPAVSGRVGKTSAPPRRGAPMLLSHGAVAAVSRDATAIPLQLSTASKTDGAARAGVTDSQTTFSSMAPPPSQGSIENDPASRTKRLRELEEFLQLRGGRRTPMEERNKAIQKSVAVLPLLYPPLTRVADAVGRYIEDAASALDKAALEKMEALRQQEKDLYNRFETFFEEKIRELVLARQQAEAQAKAEHEAAYALRHERDVELMAVKEELMERMNNCEKTEDQFRDFRHLIASVFQTNQQLNLRIEQLETVLERHRIELPPATGDVTAFLRSADGNPRTKNPNVETGSDDDEGNDGGRHGARQAPSTFSVDFMAAAKKELVSSRLTLQEELLHSAFEDHSAYRMRISGLTQQNLDLSFNVSELEEKVRDLYKYIREKRFTPVVNEAGEEVVSLTPRPREVPLSLQTELGIDLRHSTADIFAELAAVSINMKHQLNSALLRSRQLNTLSSWLDEGSESGSGGGASGLLERVAEAAVIPVYPDSAWPSIPLFLRTTISPDVSNYFWTEAQTACIMYSFFKSYKALRSRARFVRSSKMLSPPVHQLFEHREVLLVRLDACKEDVVASEENVPFGYVVAQFAREVLTNLSPQTVEDRMPLVLPGTVSLRYPKVTVADPAQRASANGQACSPGNGYTSETPSPSKKRRSMLPRPLPKEGSPLKDYPWEEESSITELELTRFTYNLWYAAVRYQPSQPLCELFLKIVDGQLPVETFDLMESVIGRVRRRLERLDGERTRRFGYPRLIKGIVRSVVDMGGRAGLRAVQAVAQTFEANHTPLYGGTLGIATLFLDETYCMRELPTASFDREAKKNEVNRVTKVGRAMVASPAEVVRTPLPFSIVTHEVPLPTTFTASSPPSMLPPIGASCIVRFCRHLVHDSLHGLYTHIEAVLSPLVEESEVVLGLYLLPLPRARRALRDLDNLTQQQCAHFALLGEPDNSEGSTLSRLTLGRISAAALTGAKLTAEAAALLGIKGVSLGYLELLESRKELVEEKRAAEQHTATYMVDKAVKKLPLLKSSTHFPFRAQHATPAAMGNSQSSLISPVETEATAPTAASIPTESEGSRAKEGGKAPGKRKIAEGLSSSSSRKSGTLTQQGNDKVSASRARQSRSSNRRSTKKESKINWAADEGKSAASQDSEQALRHATAEALLAASEEGDLVEWYSLMHTLRQTVPDLPWQIFQPDPSEKEAAAVTTPTPTGDPQKMELPVLTAHEEESAR